MQNHNFLNASKSRPEHGIYSAKVDTARFTLFLRPQFAICLIPKLASTSLSAFFESLPQKTQDNYIYNQANSSLLQNIESSYKTLVVRHPFERILSAYLYFFQKLKGKKI